MFVQQFLLMTFFIQVGALLTLLGIFRRLGSKTNRPCCAHCGSRFERNPAREVLLDNQQSWVAFRCPKCGKETLLSSADLG